MLKVENTFLRDISTLQEPQYFFFPLAIYCMSNVIQYYDGYHKVPFISITIYWNWEHSQMLIRTHRDAH